MASETLHVFLVLQLLFGFFVSTLAQDYTYWCSGNCSTPINTQHHAGIILMGGGTNQINQNWYKYKIN